MLSQYKSVCNNIKSHPIKHVYSNPFNEVSFYIFFFSPQRQQSRKKITLLLRIRTQTKCNIIVFVTSRLISSSQNAQGQLSFTLTIISPKFTQALLTEGCN